MFQFYWKNILLFAVPIVALVFWLVWQARNVAPEESREQETERASTDGGNTFSSELPGIEYEFAPPSEESGEKEDVSKAQVDKPLRSIPDLSRPISPGLRPSTKAEMEQIIGELQKNPSNAALWSELGLYRKESGDYEGARLAWEFAYELQPENALIAENLGVLYGYYLKNGLKSEGFFRAAIALEPQNIHLWLRLFELYRDVLKDTKKARSSIEEALKDNPGNEQLTALFGEM